MEHTWQHILKVDFTFGKVPRQPVAILDLDKLLKTEQKERILDPPVQRHGDIGQADYLVGNGAGREFRQVRLGQRNVLLQGGQAVQESYKGLQNNIVKITNLHQIYN